MRRGGGKSKGSAFERWVCKELSLWVSKGKRVDLFWRSAISGGRSSVARKKGVVVRQAGDICAVSPAGHALTDYFYPECKAHKRIDLGQWIVNGNGKMAGWWNKCCRDARQYGREPMLIVKQNTWPVLIVTLPGTLDQWTAPQCRLDNRHCDVSLFSDMLLGEFDAHDLYRWMVV